MHNWLPGSPEALLTRLTDRLRANPLLWSLFTISPADALAYLNLGLLNATLHVPAASSAEDRQLADTLLQALRRGSTQLDSAQLMALPASAAREGLLEGLLLAPADQPAAADAAPAVRAAPVPDVALTVAKTTLQYALRTYAQHHFIDQSFPIPSQSAFEIVARGRSIAADLTHGEARIAVAFECTVTSHVQIAGRTFTLGALRSPVEIDAGAVFSVNDAGQLCIGIGAGIMRVPGLPLPTAVLNALYARIREALPAVPIVYLPTRFDLAPAEEVSADEIQIQLSGIHVVPDALTLAFELVVAPAAGGAPAR